MPLIPDQTVRAYVQLLEEERDQAIAARRRIEAGLRSIPGIPVDDLIRMGFGGSAISSTPANNITMSPVTKEAISMLFNDDHLNDCGLKLDRDRLRHTVTGNVLLEKRHVIALRLLATNTKEDNSDS
jgi:hypothetical protein